MLEGLNTVFSRIATIESRFQVRSGTTGVKTAVSSAGGTSQFARILKKAQTQTQSADRSEANQSGLIPKFIEQTAQQMGVDPKLVQAVALTESGLNQEAISSAGAVGVMQLMPDTANALGVNPYELQGNIYGGTLYLKQLLDKYQGNIPEAVAAYNAGSGAVDSYQGIPPYAETQHYVAKVMDIYNRS